MADASLAARFAAAGLDWIVPDWNHARRVRAFVTTRRGGVSAPPYATLNVGGSYPARDSADAIDAIGENRRRLAAFAPAAPLWLEQVHGTHVAVLDAAGADAARAMPPVADAAVTRIPGMALGVRTADCLPVFLADREGTVVGAAHAGWRGLAPACSRRRLRRCRRPLRRWVRGSDRRSVRRRSRSAPTCATPSAPTTPAPPVHSSRTARASGTRTCTRSRAAA